MIHDFTTKSRSDFRNITFNDKNSLSDMGLIIKGESLLSDPVPKIISNDIELRDGLLYQFDSHDYNKKIRFNNREISYDFSFCCDNNEECIIKIREVQKWLTNKANKREPNYISNLIDSAYDPYIFRSAFCTRYEIDKNVVGDSFVIIIKVTFTVAPYLSKTNDSSQTRL